MFGWFKSLTSASAPDLGAMTTQFGRMLDAGRHVFITASNALLGGTDPQVIRDELFSTDQAINEAEQKIRRELVVHASIHGPISLPASLIFMSIVKDAERIGDYAKNIYDLRVQAPSLEKDEHLTDLIALKNRIAQLLTDTRTVFDSQSAEAARKLTSELTEAEDHCDERVKALLAVQKDLTYPATLVLCYRYFKRIVSHCRNVATSIFMPLDKIDYFDENPRPHLPPPGVLD